MPMILFSRCNEIPVAHGICFCTGNDALGSCPQITLSRFLESLFLNTLQLGKGSTSWLSQKFEGRTWEAQA